MSFLRVFTQCSNYLTSKAASSVVDSLVAELDAADDTVEDYEPQYSGFDGTGSSTGANNARFTGRAYVGKSPKTKRKLINRYH